jgi:hypothetical protein
MLRTKNVGNQKDCGGGTVRPDTQLGAESLIWPAAFLWFHRLSARIPDCHSGGASSILAGTAKFMSKTKKGSKGVGYEHWGKRPGPRDPGKENKKITHRIERAQTKKLEREENNPD